MNDRPTPDAVAIRRVLSTIAPEADLETVAPDAPLRAELELDSMDFLNFVIALGKEFDVEIPELDYPKLTTVEGCVAYLESRRS